MQNSQPRKKPQPMPEGNMDNSKLMGVGAIKMLRMAANVIDNLNDGRFWLKQIVKPFLHKWD
jgi:hypothetical protein